MKPTLASDVIREMATPKVETQFAVEYYVQTPTGSKARFSRTSALSNMRGAKSETAVLSYLRQLHPRCDIQIQSLRYL